MDQFDVFHQRMDAQDRVLAAIREDARSSTRQLDRVETQVRVTNGRVLALELFRARLEGAQTALSWRAPLIVGVVCAAVGAGVAALLG